MAVTGLGLYVIIGAMFYFFQESFIFLAEKLDQQYRYDFTSNFEERNFVMKDDAVINAVHFKVDNPKGVILYFHGNQLLGKDTSRA